MNMAEHAVGSQRSEQPKNVHFEPMIRVRRLRQANNNFWNPSLTTTTYDRYFWKLKLSVGRKGISICTKEKFFFCPIHRSYLSHLVNSTFGTLYQAQTMDLGKGKKRKVEKTSGYIKREGVGRWSRKVAAWSKLIEVYISIALSLYLWVSEFTVLSKVVLTAERKGKVAHRREMSPLTPTLLWRWWSTGNSRWSKNCSVAAMAYISWITVGPSNDKGVLS